MRFSLVICTYMRPKAVLSLLRSVQKQSLYPDEILIIDGSTDNNTGDVLKLHAFENLHYFQVEESDRGLTRQRNYGISQVSAESEIVCFLDDDTVLEEDYFKEVIASFREDGNIVGVGGVAINENRWELMEVGRSYNKFRYYRLGKYVVREGMRNYMRNILGLQSPLKPGMMPDFSHGRTCGFPLDGQTHEVDLLIGMSFAFRKSLFDHISFSSYFEGYGLYEDADFSIRALNYGKNVINTAAQLNHYHDQGGRPDKYKYGKMVLRNGWYVWRLKYANPGFRAKLKWHLTHLLLTIIRFSNVVTTSKRKEAFTDAMGRTVGWFNLMFNKPRIER